ncbi:MAG TPA: hypothetical protein VNS88_17215, partial [Nitrospiraceae bacterium]|nr:hypothetical protein [Nitrospiraceae bacterium]
MLVCFPNRVGLLQPNKRDKPRKPNDGLLTLADRFSILLKSSAMPIETFTAQVESIKNLTHD